MEYLLDLTLRSLALAGLAGTLLWIGRVKSATVRHAVWTLAAAAMLLQPVLHPLLPSITIRVLRAAPVASAPAASNISAAALLPRPSTRVPFSFIGLSAEDLAVAGVYAAVALLLLLRLVSGYARVRRLVDDSRLIEANLRESDQLRIPITVGFFHPRILLPAEWRDWPAPKLRAVLAHERAHVRRADWAIAVLARVNRAMYWFHPLAWWLERKLNLLAEQACDDAAVLATGDATGYAEALLELASAVSVMQGRLIGEGVAMARESNVQLRIDRILEGNVKARVLGLRARIALVGCAIPVLYLASTAQLAPAQSAPRAQEAPAPRPLPAPSASKPVAPLILAQATPSPQPAARPKPSVTGAQQRWLTEEVVYIITDEEKAAFERLSSDAEREHFIEQFWLRRDPTPGTSQNEYRDEHYRRIAYSNQRFSSKNAPGWQSDRGRIYIVLGPPDEIESHPRTGSVVRDNGETAILAPHENWRYRWIEGMGTDVILTFIDANSVGDYRLTAAGGINGIVKR